MLAEKQTQEVIEPKMIILNELEKGTVKTKNILHRVATKNRSPPVKQNTDLLPNDDAIIELELPGVNPNATL